jgi:hypothetical protein
VTYIHAKSFRKQIWQHLPSGVCFEITGCLVALLRKLRTLTEAARPDLSARSAATFSAEVPS